MPILTRWHSPEPFRAAVWDAQKPETLADVADLTGQSLVVDDDGTVAVTLADGRIQKMWPGWGAYLDEQGRVVVVSDGVAAEWLSEDPRAA